MVSKPSRGEIWWINLNPTLGHEQAGMRPGLIVSVDTFNHGPAGLVAVLPITTRDRDIPLHVPLHPPEGGLKQRSVVQCDQVRTISHVRLESRIGSVTSRKMEEIADILRIVLAL